MGCSMDEEAKYEAEQRKLMDAMDVKQAMEEQDERLHEAEFQVTSTKE